MIMLIFMHDIITLIVMVQPQKMGGLDKYINFMIMLIFMHDNRLIIVMVQPQKRVDYTCSKYIHDHVDIHAVAQTCTCRCADTISARTYLESCFSFALICMRTVSFQRLSLLKISTIVWVYIIIIISLTQDFRK